MVLLPCISAVALCGAEPGQPVLERSNQLLAAPMDQRWEDEEDHATPTSGPPADCCDNGVRDNLRDGPVAVCPPGRDDDRQASADHLAGLGRTAAHCTV